MTRRSKLGAITAAAAALAIGTAAWLGTADAPIRPAGPPLLRLAGNGHWTPWAQGHWLWTQPGRTSAIEVEVKAIPGGFVYRPTGSTRPWQSVLIGTRGEWEWRTPTDAELDEQWKRDHPGDAPDA